MEAYDPATDAWTAKVPLNAPTQLLATAAIGGRLYALGGTEDWVNWTVSPTGEESAFRRMKCAALGSAFSISMRCA